jgi:hypothetical protein
MRAEALTPSIDPAGVTVDAAQRASGAESILAGMTTATPMVIAVMAAAAKAKAARRTEVS